MLSASIFLYLMSGIFHFIDMNVEGLHVRLSAISYLGHFTLCTLYIIYTRRNINHPRVRGYITAAVALLYAWLIIKLMEEVIFPVDHVGNRVLWYLYYLPTIFIPNLYLIAILHFDYHETQRIPKGWWLTFAVSGLILLSIITNDAHHLAFTFPEGIQNFYRSYEYSYLYYVAMAWMFTLFFLCGIIIWQKARHRQNRRYIWIVYLGLGISVLYFIWWAMGRRIFPWFSDMYGVPEVFEAHVLLTTEMCIRVGLINANFNAMEFFEASQLSISLVDADGEVRYQTAGQVPITYDEMKQALAGDIYIDENHRLHSQHVSGGYAFWVNDLSSINSVAARLRQVQMELEEDNNLISAENDMIARRIKADEQNRLYTMLAQSVKTQLDKIEEIIGDITPNQPEAKAKLALACIYKVYIKRSCNLMLLKQNDSVLNGFELENSIRESLDYIQLNGVKCHYTSDAKAMAEADELILAYSYFQNVVEDNIEDMRNLTVNLKVTPGRINIRMDIDGRLYDKEVISLIPVSGGGGAA